MDDYFKSNVVAKAALVVVAAILMCAGTLTGEYAWRVSKCNPPLLFFFSELLKMGISAHLYRQECAEKEISSELHKMCTAKFWYDARMFCAPAFLYFAINNANLVALKYLSSHLVAMLSNMKLGMVAGLAVAYLDQPISIVQWVAIAMICVGMTVTMANPGSKSGSDGQSTENNLFAIAYGILSAAISSVASIICEKLYKGRSHLSKAETVHIQNVKLYTFGMGFNALTFMIHGIRNIGEFNYFHVVLVFLYAFGGLTMGLIMKYLDNVIRGIAVSVGTVVSTILSVMLFGNELTGHFVVGGCIVVISAHMYSVFPAPAVRVDREIALESTFQMPYKHAAMLAPLMLFVFTGLIPLLDSHLRTLV